MLDNKQGQSIVPQYFVFCAGVAQWQSVGFPSRSRGFDSHHPLHFFYSIRQDLKTVENYFIVKQKRNRISINIAATLNTTATIATCTAAACFAAACFAAACFAAACFAALLPLFLFVEGFLKLLFVRTAFSKSKPCGCGMLFRLSFALLCQCMPVKRQQIA